MPLIPTPDVISESFLVRHKHDVASVFLRYGQEVEGGRIRHFGTLCVHSDYGTYGHFWSHMGCPLKEFLCGVDTGYLLSKLSRVETDHEQSERRLKDRVLYRRRERHIDADDARDAWEAIEDAFADYSGEMAVMALYHGGELWKVLDDWTDIFASDFPRSARQFAERVWPEIVLVMREQIEVSAEF